MPSENQVIWLVIINHIIKLLHLVMVFTVQKFKILSGKLAARSPDGWTNIDLTRMHSSRMHAARFSGRLHTRPVHPRSPVHTSRHSHRPGDTRTPTDTHTPLWTPPPPPADIHSPSAQVHAWIHSPTPVHAGIHTLCLGTCWDTPPPRGQTNISKNITFPQLSVLNCIKWRHFWIKSCICDLCTWILVLLQGRIPDFRRRGLQPSSGGRQHTILPIFLKNWAVGGHPSLDLPMYWHVLYQRLGSFGKVMFSHVSVYHSVVPPPPGNWYLWWRTLCGAFLCGDYHCSPRIPSHSFIGSTQTVFSLTSKRSLLAIWNQNSNNK